MWKRIKNIDVSPASRPNVFISSSSSLRCWNTLYSVLCKKLLCEEQRRRVKWNSYPSGKSAPTTAGVFYLPWFSVSWGLSVRGVPQGSQLGSFHPFLLLLCKFVLKDVGKTVVFSLSSFTFSPLRHVCCVFKECLTETLSWQQYVAWPVWAGPASPRAAWRQQQDDKSWPHEKVCVGERLTRRSVTFSFTSCLYKFVKVFCSLSVALVSC